MGHVRDLPKKELGVDVEHDFEPKYTIPAKAKKTIAALKKEAKEADSIVLATDPDREGEAIAWHISEILKAAKTERVVFHEITKSAIDEAFEHPSKLNLALVDAQQARRILDRLVGYNLSPLLWRKVRYGLSAGRVQSVAVRLIVERTKKAAKKLAVTSEKATKDIEADLKDDTFVISEVKKTERKRAPYPPFRT